MKLHDEDYLRSVRQLFENSSDFDLVHLDLARHERGKLLMMVLQRNLDEIQLEGFHLVDMIASLPPMRVFGCADALQAVGMVEPPLAES